MERNGVSDNRLEIRYRDASLYMEYLPQESRVLLRIRGKKEWSLSSRKVPPLNGEFTMNAHTFISLLEGVWGVDRVRVTTEEGIAVDVEYDWEGWKRGDDILKVKFTKYPEARTLFYFHRWNMLFLGGFIRHVKRQMRDYVFKSRDLQFIRSEGETIISRSGEEIMRFSIEETRALRGIVENLLLKGGHTFPIKGVDLSVYPKGRWVFAPTIEQPKPIYKLYMCVV